MRHSCRVPGACSRNADLFRFADPLVSLQIIGVQEASLSLEAVLVVGGARMAPGVTTGGCVRQARAMALNKAATDLPHYGGKVARRAPTPPGARISRAPSSLP